MFAFLLGLFAFVLLVLALPLDVIFRLNNEDAPGFRLKLAWGFGLWRTPLGDAETASVTRPPTTENAHKQRRRKGRKAGSKNRRSAMAFLRSPGMPGRLVRLGKAILRQFHVREISLHLRLGLDDPAATGQLYGALTSLLMLGERMGRIDIRLQPDFSQAVFQANGRGHIRLIPLTLLGVLLGFLLSPMCWRALVASIRARKS